ncbi:FecR domain-containing protein [Flavivirga aquimarina]|uniref:FecR domain-containing protein n=1 Tax=Flavivirga aquimarina TaxID=2027862 RepID=A0ABT8WB40_9FLAO|nr:FecR domain-containing protein [Flavivirga aquimarina]MDO5970367.1 FecR domain-containing protein [Flavivirga aquimarina]
MKTIIIKYLNNAISEAELILLQDWLKDADNQEIFKKMLGINHKLDFTYQKIDTDFAYQKILEGSTSKSNSKLRKLYHTFFKYAAISILFLGLSISVYYLIFRENVSTNQVTLILGDGTKKVINDERSTVITDKKGQAIINQKQNRFQYIKTDSLRGKLHFNQLIVPYGKQFSVELSDGTLVFLNAGTKLRYPRTFTDVNLREVYLEGEALFNVKQNKERPFIVHTDKMNIRVLGTEFNVSSYKNDYERSVVLKEGSVGVYKSREAFNKNSIIIKPNQEAIIDKQGIKVRETNIEKHIAWVNGVLHFSSDRFDEIIKKLERHYNINIESNDEAINSIIYTGIFEEKTIEDILNTFQKITRFKYQKYGKNKIIISPFK